MNEMKIPTKSKGAKLTRNNIAYDFKISPYVLEVPYEDMTLKYVFSSKIYKEKFYEKIFENRQKINLSLSNRFGFQIYADIIADLKLYTTIEKRGFLILKDEEKIEWQNVKDITLSGMRMMKRNFAE